MSYKMMDFISRTRKSFLAGNSMKLKEVSNEATSEAVISGDATFARIAVVVYSLGKLSSKQHVVESTKWGSMKKAILDALNRLEDMLRKNKIPEFVKAAGSFEQEVRGVDNELSNYVRNIIDKARIKVSSSAYAQGLSLSKAAELTGANKTDLQNYIGITKIHDEEVTGHFMGERMKTARKIFSGGS